MQSLNMDKPRVDIITLSKCKVFDENGSETELYNLWQKQPAVFIFLRHFACIACRAHATEVWKRKAEFESRGAKIHFIGNGSPDFIKKFKEDLGIQEASVFTDPSLVSFKAAGFKRGFLAAMGPRSIVNGAKLILERKEGSGTPGKAGDLWQLGGTLAIKRDGKIAYHYISEAFGDFHPENDGKFLASTDLT
jgi:peroxiredoxin